MAGEREAERAPSGPFAGAKWNTALVPNTLNPRPGRYPTP